MAAIEVKVPDIGDFKDVPVIELLVKPGDVVKKDDSLVTLESDKATMEVPAPQAGTVRELRVKLGDKVALVMAEKDGEWIAGALNLVGDEALYGRNWGCNGDWPFLHFEACYYQAIDYAIKHKLARVEAGAQGPHKIQRGYLPVATWSAHWIADPRFAAAHRRSIAG